MGAASRCRLPMPGIPVTLIETGEEQLKRGMGVMQKNYAATAAARGIPRCARQAYGPDHGRGRFENVKDADLVDRSRVETMAIKKEVFEALDKYAKPGAVLASNTSYLNIDRNRESDKTSAGRARRALFSPPNVMKLCEIVRATRPRRTRSPRRFDRAQDRQSAGLWSASATASSQPDAGATRKQAESCCRGALAAVRSDAVVTKFGMPMGPFAMGDLAGLDIGWRSRKDRGIKSEIWPMRCARLAGSPKDRQGLLQIRGGFAARAARSEVEKLIDETLQRLGRKRRVVL